MAENLPDSERASAILLPPDNSSECIGHQPYEQALQMTADAYKQVARSSPIQVLFVHASSEFGGAEKHLMELISSLSGTGINISVLCLDTDYVTGRVDSTVPLPVVIRRNKDAMSFGEWYRILRSLRPDVVVFIHAVLWNFPWYASVAGWLAGVPRRFSIAHLPPPVLAKIESWSVRTVAHRLRRVRHLLGLRLSASFYTATICVSNAIRNALVTDYHFVANKTITIHNGISYRKFERRQGDGASVRLRLGAASDEFLLVCVARLSEQKAIDILLSAMARVLSDGLRCRCVIVGDGPLRKQLTEQALALRLNGYVFFEGFQEDVRPYLQAANAFVLTSHKEGLPLALLEAMACGLPCIVTNVGGNGEAITHGVHGLVVPPDSAKNVAEAISYLVTHPRECAEMSKMASSRVREAFDVQDRMAEIRHVILS
jgi:glycosyltransferase involved in cell wall biosynthesis